MNNPLHTMQELYRLHSLPPKSQLLVQLQAGLSALKIPSVKAEVGEGIAGCVSCSLNKGLRSGN